MTDIETKIEVEAEEFADELSDEAIDRESPSLMSCGGNWTGKQSFQPLIGNALLPVRERGGASTLVEWTDHDRSRDRF